MKHVLSAILWLMPLHLAAAEQTPCPQDTGAHEAVLNYLTAMHQNRFEDAFDYVTTAMTDGRSRQDWSALQARAYQPGKVQIYGVDPRRAVAAPGDSACSTRAIVPNILSSRDRLNEHGTVEFEIYRTVRDDHGWRIDSQETLFDDAEINDWFPETRALAPAATDG